MSILAFCWAGCEQHKWKWSAHVNPKFYSWDSVITLYFHICSDHFSPCLIWLPIWLPIRTLYTSPFNGQTNQGQKTGLLPIPPITRGESNRGIVNKEIRHKNHNMTNPPYGYGYGYQLKSLGATQMAFQQRYADNRGAALGKASASSKGLAWSGGGNSCGPRRPGGPRTTRSWNESFDFRGCVCVCAYAYIYI